MADTMILREKLTATESPRHGPDGRLYYVDYFDRQVRAYDLASGADEMVAELAYRPSGLGWLPDGRLVVVSTKERKVLRQEADGTLAEHADLAGVATFDANDMLVDSYGRAYVGNVGFDVFSYQAEHGAAALLDPAFEFPGATLALVEPDGTVTAAAADLKTPNGMTLLPGRAATTLVVAETLALRLTAFDVAPDGTLGNRRVWADLRGPEIAPDGICADADGGIWVASPFHTEAVRVVEGGTITHRIATHYHCMAVTIVGSRLACCTAGSLDHAVLENERVGALEIAELPGGQA